MKSLLETLRTRNKRLASESIAGFNTDTTCQTMSTPCQLAKKTIETTTKSYNAKITQPTSITLPADNLPVRQINAERRPTNLGNKNEQKTFTKFLLENKAKLLPPIPCSSAQTNDDDKTPPTTNHDTNYEKTDKNRDDNHTFPLCTFQESCQFPQTQGL